jgi:hypothetical protein
MTKYKTGTKLYVIADIEWSNFAPTDADGNSLKIMFQGDNYSPTENKYVWTNPNPQPISRALRDAVNNDLRSVVLSSPTGKRRLIGTYTVTDDVYPTIWPKARLGVRIDFSTGNATFTISNVVVVPEYYYSENGFKIHEEYMNFNQIYEI